MHRTSVRQTAVSFTTSEYRIVPEILGRKRSPWQASVRHAYALLSYYTVGPVNTRIVCIVLVDSRLLLNNIFK